MSATNPIHFFSKFLRGLLLTIFLFGIAIAFGFSPALAALCVSTTSGNWSNSTSVWAGCTGGGAPTPADSVTITAGHTITLDASPSIINLTINGTLQPDSAVRQLNLTGNFIDNGTFTASSGNGRINVTLNGALSQTITPNAALPNGTTFNDLTINTVDSNLVGFWKFDNNANDSSGNGYNGTLNGSPPPVYSTVVPNLKVIGSDLASIQFNGTTTGQYVSISHNANLDFSTGLKFTVMAFVDSNSSSPQPDGTGIIVKGDNTGYQYALDFDPSGCFRFSVRDSGGAVTSVVATGGTPTCGYIGANGWMLVAGVFDYSAGLMKLYVVDGNAQTTHQFTGTPPSSLFSNTHELSIGNRKSASGNYDKPFNGVIDDAHIYNRVLTEAELFRTARGFSPNAVQVLPLGDLTPITVNGTLTLNATFDMTEPLPNSHTLNLYGNWINNCCFQHRGGSVFFLGAGIHTLTGSTRFNNLTIQDGAFVEAGSSFVTFQAGAGPTSLSTGLAQLRRTPSGNAMGDCSTGIVRENDAENYWTIELSGCQNFTSATIRTARGNGFPNVNLSGSPQYDTCSTNSTVIRRFWQITPNGSGTRTANVTFRYRQGSVERHGLDATTLHLYKCENGTWVDQGLLSAYDTTSDPDFYEATFTNVSIGSGYVLAPSSPTAVRLSSFQANSDSFTMYGVAFTGVLIMFGLGLFAVGSLWWYRRSI